MSKAANGKYGTFDPRGIDEAVKSYCKKKGITVKVFFADYLHLHTGGWWRSVCNNRYGDETELRNVCRAVRYDFEKLDFKEGATNENVEKSKAIARKKYHKSKAPEYEQLTFDLGESKAPDLKEWIKSVSDEDLVQVIDPKRMRSLYHLAMYHLAKGENA